MADILIWFMFGWVFASVMAKVTPGYPIIVGTPSIQTGVYWLNITESKFNAGDLVTFPFNPTQDWLKGRYGNKLIHTKFVTATAGDTVYAAKDGSLRACKKDYSSQLDRWCRPLGRPQLVDSKNRVLIPWLAPDTQYTLRTGELWIGGQHAKSLDSRYHGPISINIVRGKATLLVKYGEPTDMEIPIAAQEFTEIP